MTRLEQLLQAAKQLQAEIEDELRPHKAPSPMESFVQQAASQEEVGALDQAAILRKPAGQWTPSDRESIRAGIQNVLRTMGN